ncbi:hypothetical protein RINTHH_7120 [Richelia intracellularis HH01]|uniref:Uncharacterized protein n=1 Tax=Richelia intracellularis HH01 TaxID=1165094 RepID=M1WYH4_9NOST|nr:hypothetical protein RINTHH_7120 [Richelia intracellularis HH01]
MVLMIWSTLFLSKILIRNITYLIANIISDLSTGITPDVGFSQTCW